MNSAFYEYFEIKSDKDHLEEALTEDIEKVLIGTGVLEKTGNCSFSNKGNFPWISVTCVKSINGNYSTDSRVLRYANLLVIVTSKKENKKGYIEVLKDISVKIGWSLFLEEDEDANKNVLIF